MSLLSDKFNERFGDLTKAEGTALAIAATTVAAAWAAVVYVVASTAAQRWVSKHWK